MWPTWNDQGRRVEVTWPDGTKTEGVLVAEDYVPAKDDEDEMPIWYVYFKDGSKKSFIDQKDWRFV